ncbi:MAG: hypothetical protein FWD65_02335 [Coriobacteriia bacterium]|nr:hypothetical protein [Coriobacteriia bacterium]
MSDGKHVRILALVLAPVLALSVALMLTGCSASSITSKLDSIGAPAGEDLYQKLNTAISSPDRAKSSDLPGTFTFTAKALSDPANVTVDGKDCVYISARISRNINDDFAIDLTDLAAASRPAKGDLVKVTGKLDGTVYWTEDSKRVSLLDIKASKIEKLPESTIKPSTKSTVTVGSAQYTFAGAHFGTDALGKVVIIYFDFTNKATADASPDLRKFFVFQGDGLLDSEGISVKGADPHALAANGPGIADKTYAGKTQRYYMAYEVSKDPGKDSKTAYVCLYDDDFNQTNEIALPLAASYAALQGK